MITFTTFALLAVSLTLVVLVVQLLRNIRAQEHSIECYKILHETELTRADKLEQEILSNKESSNFLLESYQEDLNVAQECIWAKEKQLSDKQEILNEVAAELFSLGFRDGIIKDVEVLRIRDLALEQNIPL